MQGLHNIMSFWPHLQSFTFTAFGVMT